MLEKNLIAAILKRLSKTIHSQSMTSASLTTNGTPDRYLDGPKGDMWIEFKQLKTMPRNGMAVGAYTALQLRWMERRHANGGNVVGIVGLPDRTACMQFSPETWKNGSQTDGAMPHKDIAAWIERRLT